MAEDFWTLAQKGERQYWESEYARRQQGNAVARKEFWKPYRDLLRRYRVLSASDRVLDLGCGPAGIITAIEEPCERIAVDPLTEFYESTYGLPAGIRYEKGVGEQLNFADGFFTTAFCINVLDHTRDPRLVWQELYRVLAPGGLLMLEVQTFRGLKYWMKRFRRWQRMRRRRIEKHPHTFHMRDVLADARRVGFQLVEQQTRPQRKRLIVLVMARKPSV